jgi:hypothetical protein
MKQMKMKKAISEKMNIAFVVGNGTSRSPIDLSSLKGKGSIIGCNALYRDFPEYDYLVAIDDGMIEELQKNANDERLIIPPQDERWEDSRYSNIRRRSNAGMNAMFEAIRMDHNKLYCLGFDFLLKGEESISNIYEDTDCYGPETHAVQSDNTYRIKYLSWCVQSNKDVSFTFVLPRDQKYESIPGSNVTGIYVDKFMEKYNETV